MIENMEIHKFNPKEFGHRLKKGRESANYTQKDFAALLDISPRTLGEIEAGRADMSLRLVFQAAEMLGMAVQHLLGLEEGKVVNSFNNIGQEATVQNNNNRVEADRAHIDTLREQLTFLKDLVDKLLREKAEIKLAGK
jgi:DNA-binding XRE family transcriptional regulator